MNTTNETLDDGHPIGGQSARLVRADRGRVAHRLTSVQMPDQVIV